VRVLLLSLPLLWLTLTEPLYAEDRIAIIVSGATSIKEALSKEELARIYQRKKLFWTNGTPIVPLSLPTTNPLRRVFSRAVLNEQPEELDAYWNEQYFHGISPPYVLASEEAVVAFVATTPGAIGYVHATAVNSHVRVVLSLPLAAEKRP
jgi:ABC-type phosphate transport system substrate-binding protein